MHWKSGKVETMISDEADKVVKKIIDSRKNRYQNNLQSMRGSAFVFNYVQLFYYKFHRVNFKPGGSYIDFPDWIKNKKATINPINNKYNKCLQYNYYY